MNKVELGALIFNENIFTTFDGFQFYYHAYNYLPFLFVFLTEIFSLSKKFVDFNNEIAVKNLIQ